MSVQTIWTVVLLTRYGRVALGVHKRGPFKGCYNGCGGKRRPGEDPFVTSQREAWEEWHIKIRPQDIREVGVIYMHRNGVIVGRCHVHEVVSSWTGLPRASSEMTAPRWYTPNEFSQLTLTHRMDRVWLRAVLRAQHFAVMHRYSHLRMHIQLLPITRDHRLRRAA